VTWTATDAAGNTATAVQNVTVVDTTAPVLSLPADVSVEATGAQTAVTIGTASATDIFAVTITNDAPATFPIGTTTVTWTATDANGNASTGTQTVTVADTTAPTVTAPANVTVEATGPTTAVSLGSATASDIVDGVLTATPDQTGPFAPGTYTITWSATDAAGNTGTATQNVTVVDTTPPVITAPANITVSATGLQTAVSIGTATATDIFAVTITNDAPATFPIGTTTVTWTATDANGNTATAMQTVTVVDTTPPVITVPPVTINPVTGTVNLGVITAVDAVDGPVTVTSNAPATFPVGTTVVTWTAADAAGNTATTTQTVVVPAPANGGQAATGDNEARSTPKAADRDGKEDRKDKEKKHKKEKKEHKKHKHHKKSKSKKD